MHHFTAFLSKSIYFHEEEILSEPSDMNPILNVCFIHHNHSNFIGEDEKHRTPLVQLYMVL